MSSATMPREPDFPTPPRSMTRAEQGDLLRLGKLNKEGAILAQRERTKAALAEFEMRLASQFAYDQREAWADLMASAKAHIAELDGLLAEDCRRLGIPENIRLAKRGKGLPRRDAGVLDVVFAPRLKPPGRKPEEVRHRLERLYGDVRRIELFARGKAPNGWAIWGDQAAPDSGLHRDLSTVTATPMEAVK